MVSVAIPRAMSYYYLYPFFKALLTEMGAEVTVSKPTTKTTLEKMSACPTDEPCIAVKLCFAHVQELREQEHDYIFLPKIISVERGAYCCPKFIGIADMVRNAFELDEKILSPRVNLSADRQLLQDTEEIARQLGLKKVKAAQIIRKAWDVQENVSRLIIKNQITTVEAYQQFVEGKVAGEESPIGTAGQNSVIGVIGHPYVLYEWVSHGLVHRFRQYGQVITPEMVDKENIKAQMGQIYEGHKLWSFEAQMLGAALHLLRNRLVDRLVLVGLFECGPESIIEAYIEEEAERLGVPLLKLFMDEQTGEAGLITRIEAFMDTCGETHAEQEKESYAPVTVATKWPVKPVVGFPSMGHLDLVVHSVLRECGIETVKPPALSRQAMELGKELVPEFVCLPLTATLGQMIQMLDLGVNCFLMVGGKGRCRLGWYAQVQELLLKRKGLSFDMVIVDSPFPLRKNGLSFLNALKKVTGGASWDKIVKSLLFGYHKLEVLDEAEILTRRLRAFEKQRGQADKAFKTLKYQIEQADTYQRVAALQKEFLEKTAAVETEETDPLKIALIGEIYVLLEPFINMEIEKFLSSREGVRVLVEKETSVSHWFRGNVLHTRRLKERAKEVAAAAGPYLSEHVGGHGQESVGLTVLAARGGLDGVIQLMPFTCMPEIVAQSILTRVSKEHDLPVLSLIISDQTGEAGIETRLEAFLDLLLERRYERTR